MNKEAFTKGYMAKQAFRKKDLAGAAGAAVGAGSGALLLHILRSKINDNIKNNPELSDDARQALQETEDIGLNNPWVQYPAAMLGGGILGNRAGRGLAEF